MKLLNNFISLGYAAIYSEALALAEKVGISPPRFDSVIRNGRMDCGFYQTFMRWTLEGDRDAHKFTIANAFKDLTYLESMADAAGIANPLGNATKNSFAGAHATGPAEQFVPMLATHIAKVNGVDLMPSEGWQEADDLKAERRGALPPRRARSPRRYWPAACAPHCAPPPAAAGECSARSLHAAFARARRSLFSRVVKTKRWLSADSISTPSGTRRSLPEARRMAR